MKTVKMNGLYRRVSDELAEILLKTGKWALCPESESPFKENRDEDTTETQDGASA